MKFDSNLAWKRASASVTANREVLLALAGVFFLLPSLAFSLLFPQPAPTPGMDSQAMMRLTSDYYVGALPFLIPMLALQGWGTLAMLTLFTDRSRPTVGQALWRGLASVFTYVTALLLVALGTALVGALALGLASVTGSPIVAVAALAVVAVVSIHIAIRTSLMAPVVAVDGERNPIAAIRRSWRLTQGNAARIGLFYVLVLVAFAVALILVMMVLGIVLALLADQGLARVIATFASSTIGSLMTLYFVAIGAAVHSQLSGPSPEAERAPFE